MKLFKDQKGVINPILIVVAVVVIAVVGFAGYKVYGNNNKKSDNSSSQGTKLTKAEEAVVSAECEKQYNDKDFCKFASKWDLSETYRAVYSIKNADGTTSSMTTEVDGENSSTTGSENGQESYAFIVLNKVSYTKDYDANVWYKMPQTESEATDAEINPADDLDFGTEEDGAKDTSSVKSLGKETCGNQTCFKYQIIDPADTETKEQYVWFDDKDYRLVRLQLIGNDGTETDSVFSYPDSIKISEPSPVEDYPTIDPSSLGL